MGLGVSLHKIGEARQALHAAIAGVLDDGRVAAYPAAQDVGIRVWIDEHRLTRSGNGILVEFPVHCTYDGTDAAQIAGIEDVVSRVWDACERVKGMEPQGSNPGPPITVGNQARRQSIVPVRVLIAAKTLCPPDAPGASPIPPDQAQE